jgi:hypothetical protein
VPEGFRNQLHFGDNLVRLRGEGVDQRIRPGARIPGEVADLIYLDPPFNSQRQYSLIFKQQKGQPSPAQIMAFTDTWSEGKGVVAFQVVRRLLKKSPVLANGPFRGGHFWPESLQRPLYGQRGGTFFGRA